MSVTPYNQYDVGAQEDFDNMTRELGREISVYTRKFDLDHQGQEDTTSSYEDPVTEVAFLQELDSQHEMIAAGQLNIGDVKIFFLHDSVIGEEDKIIADALTYKVINVSIIKGMNNNEVLYIKAFGKKVPGR
jgi:hypothetical protein